MNNKLTIISLDTVSSTNDYARELAEQGRPEISVIRASQQTAGRGRFDRAWVSPKDGGLYLSFLLRPKNKAETAFLNFVAALAVIDSLPDLPDLKVKWPNDILLRDKKIAGMLLEAGSDRTAGSYLIIGIGVNVNTARELLPDTATSLFIHTGKKYPLNRLFDTIVKEFCCLYERYEQGDTEDMLERIKNRSATLGRTVRLLTGGLWLEGTVCSFDRQGRVSVCLENGEKKTVFPREVEHLR